MSKILYALALSGLVAPGVVQAGPADNGQTIPVAYTALTHGQNRQAIEELQGTAGVNTNDPSRLINLGTAYARVGRIEDAARMFEAAIKSDIRYDLELSDGTMMDSKAAARIALQRLRSAQIAAR